VTYVHDSAGTPPHAAHEPTLRLTIPNDTARVFLVRGAREALAKLDPDRRAALNEGFLRVGRKLVATADRVSVEPGWARGTWPRRRYPQQCYAKTVKYVLEHTDIEGMRLVHGVVSHAPLFVPLDHAWVDLPGAIVFDGVVQAFFTRTSYRAAMAAVALDTYSIAQTRRLVDTYGHPGPWNALWVPTTAQLKAYAAAVQTMSASLGSPPSRQ
jgi:hypothetical protein